MSRCKFSTPKTCFKSPFFKAFTDIIFIVFDFYANPIAFLSEPIANPLSFALNILTVGFNPLRHIARRIGVGKRIIVSIGESVQTLRHRAVAEPRILLDKSGVTG